ncbi:zinc finger protein 385A isoform X1 [Anolis carolinensis]|nr:PREDICTED: zinc finger protein 385A isoform X4 [Anolis carolinensis]XP_008101812.1 PREDICTED: zinc finger protein 385A isoform X4 [Anolis carolinensis]XP_008101813.1 PREDICTED: zinc finger protein 385A isoform X4 [Anolis carolinensis]XP_008101814.1 PREDICTED: zinc finger protein 385A isoform X4 [Anolis carolinensis]|eukprot:XP_008101811.1 PREDICTED: zinc finger protein 385A isoform X4 [Anolis carolinensis]
MMQPPLDLKPFLSFPMEAQPAMGLFPGFNTVRPWLLPAQEVQARMDPVQKAVINHTFGVPVAKAKRPIISCNVCQIRFNSESQAEAHYKGNRHARRVKGIEAARTRQKESGPREGDKPGPVGSPSSSTGESDSDRTAEQLNGIAGSGTVLPVPAPTSPEKQPCLASPPVAAAAPAPPSVPSPEPSQSSKIGPAWGSKTGEASTATAAPATPGATPQSNGSTKPDEEKAKKLLYCALCKVAVNSLSQLEAHNKGTKHKTILEARSGLGPIKAYPRLSPTAGGEAGSQDPSAQERTFHCEICNVKVNSEIQLKQHISSRRHRDGVAGKPNPLLSRHKKQRGMAELTGSLAFPKDLPKSLAAGLLPNPLAVAAAMAAAASTPLTLRPAPTPPLLQGPPLTHPLLRPAPGPIRTAHGPILFSPY